MASEAFRAEQLSKQAVHDVDEYADLCLASKDLRDYLAEQRGRPASKDAAASFVKHRVKGLHRKAVVAALCAAQASRLAVEQLTAVGEISVERRERLRQLVGVLQQLLDIFQSNVNMHAALRSDPLKAAVGSLIVYLQTVGGWQAELLPLRHVADKQGGEFVAAVFASFDADADDQVDIEGEDIAGEGERMLAKRGPLRLGVGRKLGRELALRGVEGYKSIVTAMR